MPGFGRWSCRARAELQATQSAPSVEEWREGSGCIQAEVMASLGKLLNSSQLRGQQPNPQQHLASAHHHVRAVPEHADLDADGMGSEAPSRVCMPRSRSTNSPNIPYIHSILSSLYTITEHFRLSVAGCFSELRESFQVVCGCRLRPMAHPRERHTPVEDSRVDTARPRPSTKLVFAMEGWMGRVPLGTCCILLAARHDRLAPLRLAEASSVA